MKPNVRQFSASYLGWMCVASVWATLASFAVAQRTSGGPDARTGEIDTGADKSLSEQIPNAPSSRAPVLAYLATSPDPQRSTPVVTPDAAMTLEQAIALAQANEPSFAAAAAANKTAMLDRSIARSALLPQVIFHNQFLFTQPNGATNQAGSVGTQAAPKFIANNTVHEYVSQGSVTENIGLTGYTGLAKANAEAAIANAELEISRRGLTSTVVSLFYSFFTSQTRVAVQQRAANEAAGFLKLTQDRESAREAAHADVVKATLTLQQRQRDLADARLQGQKARLDLGVLLFPNPRTPYSVSTAEPKPLPPRADVEAAAGARNPEVRSALASLRARSLDITSTRAAYLPDLALNYTYGIDAAQFAAKGPDGTRNLGYSASATLDIPVWDWFATANKVKQAHILRDAAKVVLSSVQRRLIAQLDEFYAEASVAHDQLDSLQASVDAARESLDLTRLRYTAGEATVLEVVDAQNSLTSTELAQQDGIVRYQVSLANLQLLTGVI